MCGIVAFHGPRSHMALKIIQGCMLQAGYRGTHATGLAWLEAGELHMDRAAAPVAQYLDCYDLQRIAWNEPTLSLVAHTRYSTSDLHWNQPLEDENCALVMNGVISQDSPVHWPLADLASYKTGNDAEIAARFAKNDCRGQMGGSFAIVELWKSGAMLAYRNSYRPLYKTFVAGGWLVTSTQDMLHNYGLVGKLMSPGYVTDLRDGELAGLFDPGEEHQPTARDPRQLRCLTE